MFSQWVIASMVLLRSHCHSEKFCTVHHPTPLYTIPREGSTVESAPATSAGSKSRSVLGICGKFTPSA